MFETITRPVASTTLGGRGGADRSEKALPAAGTVDNSGERSAPNVDLNPNQLPGDRSEPTPDDGTEPTPSNNIVSPGADESGIKLQQRKLPPEDDTLAVRMFTSNSLTWRDSFLCGRKSTSS
jgi:hypothetical protein